MQNRSLVHSPPVGKLLFPTFLAFGWLVSTHHLPWPYFNSDFIIAAVFLSLWGTLLIMQRGPLQVPDIAYFCLAISMIPLIQYAAGLIEISGQALLGFSYLLGFFLSVLLGSVGERIQPRYVSDIVFGAFLIGSIASVGLQLQQWMGLEVSPMVNMGASPERPYANLGQPNQLGTLLLIGVSAVVWFWHRALIGTASAKAAIAFIALGLVLTKSLSAFVGMSLVILLVNTIGQFRGEFIIKSAYKTLFIYCILIYLALQLVQYTHLGGQGGDLAALDSGVGKQQSANQRLSIWSTCVLAVLNSPLFGYGWNQTLAGHLSVVTGSQQNDGLIYYAHNLVLDLFLWCGIPLGTLLIFYAVRTLFARLRNQLTTNAKVALCGVVPFLSHSMFEQPYAYAYLLLPVGVLIGLVFSDAYEERRAKLADRLALYLTTTVAAAALLVLGLDYFRISEQYQSLIYKEMRVVAVPPAVPHTLILNQWEKYFSLSLIDESKLSSDDSLNELEKLTKVIATPAIYWKKAKAQAAAGQMQASRETIDRMCKIFPENVCVAVRQNSARH